MTKPRSDEAIDLLRQIRNRLQGMERAMDKLANSNFALAKATQGPQGDLFRGTRNQKPKRQQRPAPQEVVTCDLCDMSFEGVPAYEYHLEVVHRQVTETWGGKQVEREHGPIEMSVQQVCMEHGCDWRGDDLAAHNNEAHPELVPGRKHG